MADRYDEAVAYLTSRPGQIMYAWNNPSTHPAGCLFSAVCPSGLVGMPSFDKEMDCGCLTQVRRGTYPAYTPELTNAIRADDGIPSRPQEITVDHLAKFAEWQRRIDKELNR